jgi:predicted transcriptional regulator with HTH domain
MLSLQAKEHNMATYWTYVPEIIQAIQKAGGERAQTALTEDVWGTSGRGNPGLVNAFESMVTLGLLTMEKRGRSKVFRVTPKGQAKHDELCVKRGYVDGNASLSG